MKRRVLFSSIAYIIAGGLVVAAAVLAWPYWQAETTGPTVPSSATVTTSTDQPTERQPANPSDPKTTYTVAATAPRLLKIPTIGVESFVQRVGIDQYGQVAVPNSIYFTGWYVNSVLPGQAGITIIDGHLGGRYNKAIFADLDKLQTGDTVLLQRGDLSWLTYTVEQKKVILPDDNTTLFAKQLVSSAAASGTSSTPSASDAQTSRQQLPDNELHLITCNGVYLPAQKTYDHRVMVTARLSGVTAS